MIEECGKGETAKRTLLNAGQVFRFGVATGRAKRDPTADLRGALAPVRGSHHPAIIEPKAFGALLRAIDGYPGEPVTRAALRLLPLVFTRPGELRLAEWAEFDPDSATWSIPSQRMKMKQPHIVPLSAQAVTILRELHPLTGRRRLVFPSLRSRDRPMADATLTVPCAGSASRAMRSFHTASGRRHGRSSTRSSGCAPISSSTIWPTP